MIEYVQEQTTSFNELPYKFEAGSQNVEGAVALHAAIDYLNDIGMDQVEEHERELTDRCLEGMLKMPHIHILGSTDPKERPGSSPLPSTGSIPTMRPPSWTATALPSAADTTVPQPLGAHLHVEASNRVSFYIYNTLEEVDYFLSKLPEVRKVMGFKD